MTYSLAITGRRADFEPAVPAVLTVDDATAGQQGSQSLAMQNNSQVLCKNRDGSQTYYTIDAERSTPGNLVLLAVGP